MPFNFGRRSRSVSVSRPTTPSSSTPALLAASLAVQGHQGQSTKLATGAAAAALRSMSPASTPVSQVQTKRMVERKNSGGSNQNATRGRSRGNNLQRQNSSSSMTERTFRDSPASPARPSTSSGVPAPRAPEPPVPKLPEDYSNVPPVPPRSHRRSASIDELQVRKNANANAKQPPNRNSMAAAPTPKAPINPGLAAAKRVTSGATAPQLDRTDSNGSVNFSYPGRARPSSPPPQQQTPAPARKAPLQTASPQTPQAPRAPTQAISQVEARNIQHDLAQTAQQPVKRRKNKDGPLAQGSHLHTGTMGHKPVVTPLAPGPPQEQETPDLYDRGQNQAKIAGQASHFPPSPVSPTDSQPSPSDSERTQTRRAQRASGALLKQPSVVREDWEGEQVEDSSPIQPSPPAPPLTSAKRPTPEANVSRKIEGANVRMDKDEVEPVEASPVSTSNLISSRTLATPEPRKPSLSPSRSTRFSNRLSADMTEGHKHDPPPRSISPRKSALKHGTSPQMLAIDAHRTRDSSASPSEATDLSTDAPLKQKKSAHVKFDTHPAVVGIAAEPESPASPQVVSPQNRSKDKKWFNLGRKPQRVNLAEDSDEDDTMKPRPMLPTFGSVRGDRKGDSEPSGPKAAISPSSSSSSLSSAGRPDTMDTSISSDHAIGGLLARNHDQAKQPPDSPLPPQVTSVEGSGMHSDTESNYSVDDAKPPEPIVAQPVPPKSDQSSFIQNAGPAALPSIAVQPATPGVEEDQNPKDQWLVDVPGGFPSADQESVPAKREQIAPEAESLPETETEPRTVQLPEPTTIASDNRQDRMPSIQEEDSDKDSIYSDAAEDVSDFEGDGFGSINAIVRSPVVASPTSRDVSDSPVANIPVHDGTKAASETADWQNTSEKWKDHVENLKRTSLQPAAQISEAPTSETPVPKTRTRKAPRAETVSANSIASPISPIQTPTPTGTRRDNPQAGFRKSMRTGPETSAGPTLRNRGQGNEGPATMRSSMRNSAPPPARAASPPIAAPAPPAPAPVRGALQKRNLPTTAPAPRQQLPPVNNDSDSESSFRRRRRARASDTGKYTMRRSMRADATDASGPSQVPRSDPRSMSPVERRPFSPVGGQPMRTTLRGSRGSTDNVPTLRGNQTTERRSSSLFGRKKESKPANRPMSAQGFRSSRIAADSDDEAPPARKAFKSRFSNSSDEEDDLRPVRGIPRANKDDDSTDLDDSSDDEAAKARKARKQPQPTIVVPASPQPSERPGSPTSLDGKKRKGLFGRFKKNKAEAASPEASPVVNGRHEAKATSADTTALGFRSDAEKEALIEQTRLKLEAAREAERPTSPTPTPGRLQRRITPQRVMSDSWPLPPEIPESEPQTPDRPFTSDGSAAPKRPDLERAPSSASTPVSAEGATAYGKTGKKKRFPLLRKAFGLKD